MWIFFVFGLGLGYMAVQDWRAYAASKEKQKLYYAMILSIASVSLMLGFLFFSRTWPAQFVL